MDWLVIYTVVVTAILAFASTLIGYRVGLQRGLQRGTLIGQTQERQQQALRRLGGDDSGGGWSWRAWDRLAVGEDPDGTSWVATVYNNGEAFSIREVSSGRAPSKEEEEAFKAAWRAHLVLSNLKGGIV